MYIHIYASGGGAAIPSKRNIKCNETNNNNSNSSFIYENNKEYTHVSFSSPTAPPCRAPTVSSSSFVCIVRMYFTI